MTNASTNATASAPVALITAGAAGIGRVMAEAFINQGCLVHVCDIEQPAIDAFLRANPECTATLADVADVSQVDRVFAEISDQYGQLEILVNNAGIAGPTAHVEDIEPADWDHTIAVNLNGQFYCARLAVPLLKAAGGGSIINIASNAALSGCPSRAPYAASKWAVIGLTKTLAMELGPFGIRVNAICPSSVVGPRIDAVIERDAKRRGRTIEEIRTSYLRQSSLRCFVNADDVANLALFLASDSGAKISGQALGLDGHTESLANWHK
jgi:NAD(P)-dependent dehydrogenase (short-subunit alcohol dehydrogenase family)